MKEESRILIVDDEKIALNNLSHILTKEGYAVTATQSGPGAIKYLESEEFDLVLTDLKMEKVDGMQILKRSRELHPDTEVIMITGYATVDSAIDAMKAGAYHYIAKPYKLDEVRKVVKESLEKNRLKKENALLKERLKNYHGLRDLITDNQYMRQILALAKQVASTDTNVVISGESGTGKELLANYIHNNSVRSAGIMVAINCGVFTEDLLANELFGHEKGAFTGADDAKKGLVETANNGTLFLDEITEMPLAMQVKLLRVIQEKEVLRVGGTSPIKVNVRFIAATNRNLQAEVDSGRFRRDLFFRINVVAIELPPLSGRRDDIPILSLHFLKKYASLMEKEVTTISPEVSEILMSYGFPGNVRELENIIERGVALTNSQAIELSHLPDDLRGSVMQTFRKSAGKYSTLEELEKTYVEWVLKEKGQNKTETAKELGIDRVSLWRKLKKFGLE
ncbi:MAG: sigma-54 dependent transcriptional regulator [Proteobacteria bacterium]|nr:sigma-54 dependent transcriptional regulator [Pseudomonadota bacterium]MBU1711127.1 sigma-54 dependent transcriptional regulator [Pseudomonadota bacterium]